MFKANTAVISTFTDVAENYKDIFNRNDIEYWKEVVKEDMHSMETNKVCKVVGTPPSSNYSTPSGFSVLNRIQMLIPNDTRLL